jgi:hypothetical protein
MVLGNQKSKGFPMLAVKLEAVVSDNHQLVLQVPDEIPAGTVEIVILAKGKPLGICRKITFPILRPIRLYVLGNRV